MAFVKSFYKFAGVGNSFKDGENAGDLTPNITFANIWLKSEV